MVEKRIFLSNPTIANIKEAVEELKKAMQEDFPYQKIGVEFSEEVEVRVNQSKVRKLKEMKVNFFESSQGNFCYTFYARTGHPLYTIDYKKICSLYIVKPDAADRQKKVERFLKKFHPNAWDDIKQNPDKIKDSDMETVNIKNKFPPEVIEQLKKAFDQKLDFYYFQPGEKRDLSVKTKLGEDGIFRAWYSSEFAGYGNGSYYLLINPTTAAFREDD